MNIKTIKQTKSKSYLYSESEVKINNPNPVEYLGSENYKYHKDGLIFKTICHDGDSYKLYYYSNSNYLNYNYLNYYYTYWLDYFNVFDYYC